MQCYCPNHRRRFCQNNVHLFPREHLPSRTAHWTLIMETWTDGTLDAGVTAVWKLEADGTLYSSLETKTKHKSPYKSLANLAIQQQAILYSQFSLDDERSKSATLSI
jgi:hypothetical protein